MTDVSVEPLRADRRAACLALRVHEDQRRFVAPVRDYVAMCEADGVWRALALVSDGGVVGFAMWALDADDGSHWLGGVLIDRAHQRRGLGRAAMHALLAYLRAQPGCREVALSYHPDNEIARRLYASLGFRESGEVIDGEVVARYPADHPRG